MGNFVSLPFAIAVFMLLIASGVLVWVGLGERLEFTRRLNRRLFNTEEATATGAEDVPDRLVIEDRAIRTLPSIFRPKDEKQRSLIEKRLVRAGYRMTNAVQLYLTIKWAVAVFGFVCGALILSFTMNPAQPLIPILAVGLTVLISLFATDMWVERKAAYRRNAIEKSFPDALDLMLVCIEAGHGLDQATARVAREVRNSGPELAEELQIMVGQLRAGRERVDVLADFSERTGVADIQSFVTVLRQADQFGVSIGDTLRVFAAEMRNKRFMRAEEKANLMPVQLALGAIVFTVPPTIIILVGPSIIMIVREMAKASSGGG